MSDDSDERMAVMVISEPGDRSVFEARTLPIPQPGPGEVLVRVHATTVNPIDVKIRRRGDEMGVEFPIVAGYDVSGAVVEVGPGVESFSPGDEVFYTPELFAGDGAYAEYQVSDADIVAKKPDGLTHVQAASLPATACTAWDALVERADLTVGETVLVHGVGGVGSQVVQVAKAAGARVIASSSPTTTDLAADLGADVVIEYASGDLAEVVKREVEGEGVDLAVTTAGGGLVEDSIPLTRPHGRIVDIVGDAGTVDAAKNRNVTVAFMALKREREKLDSIRRLVERGQIRPVIDSVLPLEDIAEAHRRLEEGSVAGKIVLEVR